MPIEIIQLCEVQILCTKTAAVTLVFHHKKTKRDRRVPACAGCAQDVRNEHVESRTEALHHITLTTEPIAATKAA